MDYEQLFESIAQALMGDAEEMSYAELDIAFMKNLAACGYYEKWQQDELFGIWIKAFDHAEKHQLTENEQAKLLLAIQHIIEYRRRLN